MSGSLHLHGQVEGYCHSGTVCAWVDIRFFAGVQLSGWPKKFG